MMMTTTTATREIRKSSSSRTVDTYRSTAPQCIDGEWVVIVRYGSRKDDHGGYEHILTVRDATEHERQVGRAAELRETIRRIGNDQTQQRDKAEMQAELAALEAEIDPVLGTLTLTEDQYDSLSMSLQRKTQYHAATDNWTLAYRAADAAELSDKGII
jgi:hypothetical protein